MKTAIGFLIALMTTSAFAEPTTKITFSFKNADLVQVLEEYAKASGQKFIIDPQVHGKVTLINAEALPLSEAFNQLSTALALNSCGISKQDDVMVVMPARMLQRNLIDVATELPPLRPEKMSTWVIPLKFASADQVNREIRTLVSKDGEMAPDTRANQIVITDWSSNLHRVAKLMQNLDVQVAATGTVKKPATKSKPSATN